MFWNAAIMIMLFFFLGMNVCSCLKPFRIRRYWYFLVLLFALSLAVLGYRVEPLTGMDLYRLYGIVDYMRLSCNTLADALVPQEGDPYGALIFFRALCFFVSRLPSNGWLPFISIMTTVSLLLCMLINYLRSENYSTRMILPSLCIIFMGMQMQYVFSGVRNAMAVALTVTGVYLLLYKRKHRILAVILYLLAVTIHPVVLAILPVLALCWIPRGQWVFRGVALLSLPVFFATAEVMLELPMPLLQSVGQRILYYTDRAYLFDRPEMIANTAMFLAIGLGYGLICWVGKMPREGRGWRCYINAYCLMGCMMIGCIGRRDFTLRIGYLMGIAAVPLLCRLLERVGFERNLENRKVVQAVILVVVVGLVACCAKVYYDTLVVMGQWEFMGF